MVCTYIYLNVQTLNGYQTIVKKYIILEYLLRDIREFIEQTFTLFKSKRMSLTYMVCTLTINFIV